MSQHEIQNIVSEHLPTLLQWVQTQAAEHFGEQLKNKSVSLVPVPGDAGFRHYFRLNNAPQALLAVFAPPATATILGAV